MLENVRFNWRIRKMRKRAQEAEKALRARIDVALAEKNHELERELVGELLLEQEFSDIEIKDMMSRHLRDKAERLLLPWPQRKQDDPDWEESRVDGHYRLTTEALAKLRAEIRREHKERTEQVFMWLAMLTGVIGAFTGFIAVLLG